MRVMIWFGQRLTGVVRAWNELMERRMEIMFEAMDLRWPSAIKSKTRS